MKILIEMHLKKQQISFSIYKIAMLLLYIPFFVVHGYFNLDNLSGSKVENSKPGYKKTAISHRQYTLNSSANKNNGKQATIRLNKRFQPETAPAIENFYFEIPVVFLVINSSCNYANPFRTLPHLYTGILRGPPAVA